MKTLENKINEVAIAVQNEKHPYKIKIEDGTVDAVRTFIETEFADEGDAIVANDKWGIAELIELIVLNDLQASYTIDDFYNDMMGEI